MWISFFTPFTWMTSSGAAGSDAAYELYLKFKLRLAEGGFNLRKFVLNSKELTPEELISQDVAEVETFWIKEVGEEPCDVFETLTTPEPTEGNDEYKIAVKALTDYFEPQRCVDHHV